MIAAPSLSECQQKIKKRGITTKAALQDEIVKAAKAALQARTITDKNRGVKNGTLDLNYIDTSQVADMSSLFYDIRHDVKDRPRENSYLSTLDFNVSCWNVSKVTNMSTMFRDMLKFNGNISNWNVSKVENMDSMFFDAAAFNQDIGGWTVSAVENMDSMFWGAIAFNQDIGEWTVSAVTTMGAMFSDAKAFNQDISRWTVSAVTDMSYMFFGLSYDLAFDQDLSGWDVKSVTNHQRMFEGSAMENKREKHPTWP